MTTAQIVILSLITIVFIISLISTERGRYDEMKGGTFGMLLAFLFTMLIAVIAIMGQNKLAKGCPQYEKIENVYKLK